MAAEKEKPNYKVVAENRRARHDYEIGEVFEAGLMLTGPDGHVFAELLDLVLRVEEVSVGGDGEIVDQQHVFAQLFQDARHRQLASQGIAVGPDVADQQESPTLRNDFNESGPGNRRVYESCGGVV